MPRYFEYTDAAADYLKAHDVKLARVIDVVGPVRREMDGDLFTAVVHHIVAQQISSAALQTVWGRLLNALGEVTPDTVGAAPVDELQSFGISFKKAGYIKDFADKVLGGSFDLDAVARMDDAQAIGALSSLRGVGVWTAEMLLLFCLGRQDVLSFDDLAIRRGMRMVYHHREITRDRFERYRKRYSPYGSVASLYLWEVSHMDVPGYDRDYAPKRKPARGATRESGGQQR